MTKDEAFENFLDIVARFLDSQKIDADDLVSMKRCGCEGCLALHDMQLAMLPLMRHRKRQKMN